MIFESEYFTNSPNSERSSLIFCSSTSDSGKLEIILPASDISRITISILACFENIFIMGRRE